MTIKRLAAVIGGVLVLMVAGLAGYLATLDVDDYRGEVLAAVEAATGRKATLAAPIRLAISLQPTLVLEGFSLGGPPGREGPALIEVTRIEGAVALLPLLGGDIEVRRLEVDGAQVHLERYADGSGSWTFEGGAPSGGEPRIPSLVKASITASRLHFRDAGGTESVVEIERLDLGRTDDDRRVAFSLKAALDGTPIEGAGEGGLLSELFNPTAPYPIDATFDVLGVKAKLAGTAAQPIRAEGLALEVDAQAASLGELAERLEVELPREQPLALKAAIRSEGTAIALRDIEASVGDNRVRGRLDLAFEGGRARISGKLHAEALDLAQLTADPPAQAPPRKRVFSETPLDLAGLRAVDADIEFTGDSVKTALGSLNELRAHLKLDAGALRVEPLRARYADSGVEGSVALSGVRPGAADLSLALEGRKMDVARLLEILGEEPVVRGRADLSMKLAGRGASAAALAGSLDGRVTLMMGAAEGKLAALDNVVGGVTKVFGDITGGGAGEWTPIECVAVDFRLERGLASHEVLLLDTDSVTVVGEGTVNLGTERLNLKLTPRPKTTTLNVSLPVDVGGTLLEPTFTPNKAAAARRVGGLVGSLVFPPAALAAFADMGSDEDHPCRALAAGGNAPAPPASAQRKPAPEKKESKGFFDSITSGVKGVVEESKSLFGN